MFKEVYGRAHLVTLLSLSIVYYTMIKMKKICQLRGL